MNAGPIHPAERMLSSLIAKAVQDFAMIRPGDRILIAASGGKDSTALAYDFSRRVRYSAIPFGIGALHVATEYSDPGTEENLRRLFAEWEVPLGVTRVSLHDRLKPGRKMNCYWCSTQRRTELINFALREGYNKIALGHHLDDIIETLFMNMTQKSELSTMMPVLAYRKYPITILRPLALLEERQIVQFAVAMGLDRVTCSCSHQDRSRRKKIRTGIEALTGGRGELKRNIFRSMGNVNSEYLPRVP